MPERVLTAQIGYFLNIISFFDISRRSINCRPDSLMPFETTPQFWGEHFNSGSPRCHFHRKIFKQLSGIWGIWGGWWASRSEEPDHELSVAMVIYLLTCAETSRKVAGKKLQPQQMQLRLSKGQVKIWVTFKIKELKGFGLTEKSWLLLLYCSFCKQLELFSARTWVVLLLLPLLALIIMSYFCVGIYKNPNHFLQQTDQWDLTLQNNKEIINNII